MSKTQDEKLETKLDNLIEEIEAFFEKPKPKGKTIIFFQRLERQFNDLIEPFNQIEQEICELDAVSNDRTIEYISKSESVCKKIFFWSCVTLAFSFADLQLVLNDNVPTFSVFGLSLQGLSSNELNFAFLALIIFYHLKSFWINCSLSAVMTSYSGKFSQNFASIIEKRAIIQQYLETYRPTLYVSLEPDLALANEALLEYNKSYDIRHALPSIMYIIIFSIGAALTALLALWSLNLDVLLPIPLLNTPTKLAIALVLFTSVLNVYIGRFTSYNVDLKFIRRWVP